MPTKSTFDNMKKSRFGSFSEMASEKQKSREKLSEIIGSRKKFTPLKNKKEDRQAKLDRIAENRKKRGYQVREREGE